MNSFASLFSAAMSLATAVTGGAPKPAEINVELPPNFRPVAYSFAKIALAEADGREPVTSCILNNSRLFSCGFVPGGFVTQVWSDDGLLLMPSEAETDLLVLSRRDSSRAPRFFVRGERLHDIGADGQLMVVYGALGVFLTHPKVKPERFGLTEADFASAKRAESRIPVAVGKGVSIVMDRKANEPEVLKRLHKKLEKSPTALISAMQPIGYYHMETKEKVVTEGISCGCTYRSALIGCQDLEIAGFERGSTLRIDAVGRNLLITPGGWYEEKTVGKMHNRFYTVRLKNPEIKIINDTKITVVLGKKGLLVLPYSVAAEAPELKDVPVMQNCQLPPLKLCL